MNKKLLAVAVAGALAAPLAAYAQSSVTISGKFQISLESYKYSNSAKSPNGSVALAEDASRIIFSVVEDLGGGLSAIGQLDIRFKPDDSSGTADASTNVGQGATFAGLRSKSWGSVTMGRHDGHSGNTESDMETLGNLRSSPQSLLSLAAAGATTVGTGRKQNSIRYLSPNWGGFTMLALYSTNRLGADADIGSGLRKGSAWILNPNMKGSNYQVGYSYWTSKRDAGLATDQRSDRLYGSYKWGGFKFGLVFDKTRLKSATTGAATSRRTAWSIPLSYEWGNHRVDGHYTKARDDSVMLGDNSAKMIAASYGYKLSARTLVTLTYLRITNATEAMYQPYTANANGSVAGAGLADKIALGEDPRLWSLTFRHAF